ncbi:MAG: RNA polymerase sigma factor [Myxococcota bacterium]
MPRSVALADIQRLYETYGAEVRQTLGRLAPGLDADDLLQEVFLIAISRPERLRSAKSPRAWLFGIAVKLAATRARSARLRRFFGLETAGEVPAVDAPSRSVEQRDAQRAVARALESVSVPKREAFVLFELQGLSGEEVAEALNIPLKTVWTRLHHARKEVIQALERQLLVESRTSGLAREEIRP